MSFHKFISLLFALGLASLPVSLWADEAAPLSVKQVLYSGAPHVGQEVVLEGFVTGVCHSGGRKAFLHDLNPDTSGTLRVERTGNMRAFDQDLAGQTLRITGIVRERRIDEAYLAAWEGRVRAAHAAKEEKEECEHDCEQALASSVALKRIASLREKLARSSRGYLSSFWVDGLGWEVKS